MEWRALKLQGERIDLNVGGGGGQIGNDCVGTRQAA